MDVGRLRNGHFACQIMATISRFQKFAKCSKNYSPLARCVAWCCGGGHVKWCHEVAKPVRVQRFPFCRLSLKMILTKIAFSEGSWIWDPSRSSKNQFFLLKTFLKIDFLGKSWIWDCLFGDPEIFFSAAFWFSGFLRTPKYPVSDFFLGRSPVLRFPKHP